MTDAATGRKGPVPRERGARRPAGEAFTDLVIRTFRLNGHFLANGDRMAWRAGLTSARWQVLGAVLPRPLPVSGIARVMGLARQSVQRVADALVDEGMAEYRPNPRHRRAKLLAPTARGHAAIDVIRPLQHAFADHVTASIDAADLRHAVDVMDRIIERLETSPWKLPPGEEQSGSTAPARPGGAPARRGRSRGTAIRS